jgi:hypothetical protein
MDYSDGKKRARHGGSAPARDHQLLLATPELQARIGKKYCNECELLPLLFANGLVRRVCTIEVMVQPVGGDNFSIQLDAERPSVREAKAEIARIQGTLEDRQELYKVAVGVDGREVREDDADPELLDDEGTALADGDQVALTVKETPVWQNCDEQFVNLSDGGKVATLVSERREPLNPGDDSEEDIEGGEDTLVTSGIELTTGHQYWEVELLNVDNARPTSVCVGVCRPSLNPNGDYANSECQDAWFISVLDGTLWGNGKCDADAAGVYNIGDRVGVLLDLNDGSLRFFKNGVQHGPGYPARSVVGPVVHAVQLVNLGESARMLPNAKLAEEVVPKSQ